MQDRRAVGLGGMRIDGEELVPLAPADPVGVVAEFLEELPGVATLPGAARSGRESRDR
jgi:hypothetical protein